MKVDIIKKFKWYIVGFILVAIMLSVSLSFCTWDSLSLQAKLNNSGSGSYKMYRVVDDGNSNGIADVGDIVTFGNYYQNLTDDGNVADKTAIRWIVVHKENNQLTLLTEKVVAFGSFWGTRYHNGTEWEWGTLKNGKYYQNYSQSTLRAWLNSSTRTDGGTDISKTSEDGVIFKGFLSEAFTGNEQEYIVEKMIPAMKGAGIDNSPVQENYTAVKDKIWTPSYTELYGNTGITWGVGEDSIFDVQFTYFANAKNSKAGKTTAFASSMYSNYTYKGVKGAVNSNNTSADSNAWWRLRSPHPSDNTQVCMVETNSSHVGYYTDNSRCGVRPAICIPL